MRSRCQSLFSGTLLTVAVVILIQLNLSAFNSDKNFYIAFKEGGEKNNQDCATLKDLVAEGNGYFLKSYSDFVLFLNRIEIGERDGLDYNAVQLILNRAIKKMEFARDSYIKLKQIADVTPYDPVLIDELSKFDYDGFQKRKKLIKPIFEQIKSDLIKGKIREIYGKIISHTSGVLEIANIIKTKVEAGKFPESSKVYELNEACSRAFLFGQYVSRVFREVGKIKQ